MDNDPVGAKVKKPRTAAQLAINQSLKNAKGRINAAGRKWNFKQGPAIAKMLREGAAAANIDAKIAELEVKAAKEEKKAVKAAAESASAAAAGNSVKAAVKAAEAAGAAAEAGVLTAAANGAKTKRARTNKEKAVNALKQQTAKVLRNAGKKWSPKTAATVFKALRAGNAAAVNAAVASAAAQEAVAKAAAVANAAPGVSKKNAWQDNIRRAREQLKRNVGAAANQYKYGMQLASAMRKGDNAGVAAAVNKIRANVGARTAKAAAKKPVVRRKTEKKNSLNSLNRASAAGSPVGNALYMNRAVSPNANAQAPRGEFEYRPF